MSESSASGLVANRTKGVRLPSKDLVILPCVVITTIVVMLLMLEVGSRILWPEILPAGCSIARNGVFLNRPFCSMGSKAAEGSRFVYHFNDCGYRSRLSCGPKPNNTLRVAVMGTSIAGGYWVAYERTFSGRSEVDLSWACGVPVDFQNLSAGGLVDGSHGWNRIQDRVDEAIALRPDAIVLLVSPRDLTEYAKQPTSTRAPGRSSLAHRAMDVVDAVRVLVRRYVLANSRAAFMAQHFLYLDPSSYVPLFLLRGDDADFLHAPLSTPWQKRLEVVQKSIASMSVHTKAAGVPLVILYVPPQVEASLAFGKPHITTVDPEIFPNAVRDLAAAYGAGFVDVTESFHDLDPAGMYMPADGHPTAAGHALIARDLDIYLINNNAAFKRVCSSTSLQRSSHRLSMADQNWLHQ